MTLVILAAGMGSRYGGLKQLDPMTDNGEFILDFSIYDAIRAGFDRVVFIIKEENLELFQETVGNRIAEKIKVEYAFQSMTEIPCGCSVPSDRTKPLGTGHAVYCVKNIVNDNFAVINADDYYGRDTFVQLATHLRNARTENGVAHHCMVGFRLANTLTENGSVSRGQCKVDERGMLINVTERTKIVQTERGAAYLDDDGETWIDLPQDTIVSMNCWGFTPDVFVGIESGLRSFLAELPNNANPLKAEFYLPFSVDEQNKQGACDVRVYPTNEVWQGVTYPEDKPRVKAAIRELIAKGRYPSKLWN
ncbi:MAG: nucleotidyltransferase [Clostridia bacterium]|nr:nucleotidyltransferase [Clostridia bacterium]